MSSLVLLWAFLCNYMRRGAEIAYGGTSFADLIAGQRKKPCHKAELS